tara:strand:- start:187 stop:489 length:303 start_codon:yes stop_codon:yes gene_type:complete
MPLQLVVENKLRRSAPRKASLKKREGSPTVSQLNWLERGISQAGGKLPLFDENGKRFSERTVLSCIEKGWAKPWFKNPIKPDWQVCRLTKSGRRLFVDIL